MMAYYTHTQSGKGDEDFMSDRKKTRPKGGIGSPQQTKPRQIGPESLPRLRSRDV